MGPILVASILGGVLAVDFRSSLRIMFSQPICGGLITGIVLGSPLEGFFAGALFQMMFLGNVTIRGDRVLDLPVGGVAASALYILSIREFGGDISVNGIVLFFSILMSILVAGAGQVFYSWWEKMSGRLTGRAFDYIREGRFRVASAVHISILLVHFLYAFLLLMAVLPVGRVFIVFIVAGSGNFFQGSLSGLYLLLPFIAIGSLIKLHLARLQMFWFAIGFLLTVIIVMLRG